ncbi:unnamed protein product [Trichogramma brassicae]|uniref:Uncharacterized protein n=1 Tax=Trichogramma brassicae TaxID=86971 RepID=A0A6H5IM77_9HYME|nr:unnamed protein product [Trichogramma brassicae]
MCFSLFYDALYIHESVDSAEPSEDRKKRGAYRFRITRRFTRDVLPIDGLGYNSLRAIRTARKIIRAYMYKACTGQLPVFLLTHWKRYIYTGNVVHAISNPFDRYTCCINICMENHANSGCNCDRRLPAVYDLNARIHFGATSVYYYYNYYQQYILDARQVPHHRARKEITHPIVISIARARLGTSAPNGERSWDRARAHVGRPCHPLRHDVEEQFAYITIAAACLQKQRRQQQRRRQNQCWQENEERMLELLLIRSSILRGISHMLLKLLRKCSENAIHPGAHLAFSYVPCERKSVTSVGLRTNATLHLYTAARECNTSAQESASGTNYILHSRGSTRSTRRISCILRGVTTSARVTYSIIQYSRCRVGSRENSRLGYLFFWRVTKRGEQQRLESSWFGPIMY